MPSGFRFTHPLFRCGLRLIVFIVFDTDFVIVGVVERGISSITKYLGVFLLLYMYIFDLREEKRQTIRCTPHIKDFKSSVPSRRSPLRSILGFHCDLVGLHCVLVGLHCVLRSPLRSILGFHCDIVVVLHCDIRSLLRSSFSIHNKLLPHRSKSKQAARNRKGSPTHSHKSNKRRGWNLCWFISTDTPFAHHFLEPTAR